jgi:hypothetical protein
MLRPHIEFQGFRLPREADLIEGLSPFDLCTGSEEVIVVFVTPWVIVYLPSLDSHSSSSIFSALNGLRHGHSILPEFGGGHIASNDGTDAIRSAFALQAGAIGATSSSDASRSALAPGRRRLRAGPPKARRTKSGLQTTKITRMSPRIPCSNYRPVDRSVLRRPPKIIAAAEGWTQ